MSKETKSIQLGGSINAPIYPDPSGFDTDYHNEILVTTVFKLPPHIQDRNLKQFHIQIKQFPSSIFSEERRLQLQKLIDQIIPLMPLNQYAIDQSDFFNQRLFEASDYNKDLTQYPDNQLIYQKFSVTSSVGCQHYLTTCQLQCKLCYKFYTCRLCHDEVEDHEFPRFDTDTVKCMKCQKSQKFGKLSCIHCDNIFGVYICKECKFVCHMGKEAKPTRHCQKCGVCMVGFDEFSQHCDRCGKCVNRTFFSQHICAVKAGDCPVCMESFQKSILSSVQLPCRHLIHQHCLENMVTQLKYNCPLCKRFMISGQQKELLTKLQNERINCSFVLPYMSRSICKFRCNDCQGVLYQYGSLPCYCPNCKVYNSEVIEQSVSKNLLEEYLVEHAGLIQQPRKATLESLKTFLLEKSTYTDFKDVEKELHVHLNCSEDALMFCALLNEHPCVTWIELKKYVQSKMQE